MMSDMNRSVKVLLKSWFILLITISMVPVNGWTQRGSAWTLEDGDSMLSDGRGVDISLEDSEGDIAEAFDAYQSIGHKSGVIATNIFSSDDEKAEDDKGYVINFNNLSIIEVIRFISKISSTNFIFDEGELDFKVTIVSEGPTSLDNIMAALLQILRIHNLSLLQQDNTIVIHKNKAVVMPPALSLNDDGSTVIATHLFRVRHLAPERLMILIQPYLSADALVNTSPETGHLLVTDITVNVEKIKDLLTVLDVPNLQMDIASYKVKNLNITMLINLALKIVKPLSEGMALELVPQPVSSTIFIVSTPYLIKRTLAILETLDQGRPLKTGIRREFSEAGEVIDYEEEEEVIDRRRALIENLEERLGEAKREKDRREVYEYAEREREDQEKVFGRLEDVLDESQTATIEREKEDVEAIIGTLVELRKEIQDKDEKATKSQERALSDLRKELETEKLEGGEREDLLKQMSNITKDLGRSDEKKDRERDEFIGLIKALERKLEDTKSDIEKRVDIGVRGNLDDRSVLVKEIIDALRREPVEADKVFLKRLDILSEDIQGYDEKDVIERKALVKRIEKIFSEDVFARKGESEKRLAKDDALIEELTSQVLNVLSNDYEVRKKQLRQEIKKVSNQIDMLSLQASSQESSIFEEKKQRLERIEKLESRLAEEEKGEDVVALLEMFRKEVGVERQQKREDMVRVVGTLEERLALMMEEKVSKAEVAMSSKQIRTLMEQLATFIKKERVEDSPDIMQVISAVENTLVKEGTRTREDLVIRLSDRLSKMEETMRRDVGTEMQKNLKTLLGKAETIFKAPKVSKISDEQRLQFMEQVVIAVRSSLEEDMVSQIDKDLAEAMRTELAGERKKYESIVSSLEQKFAQGDENRRGLQEKVSGFSRDIQAQGVSQDKLLMDIDKILSIVEAKALVGEGLGTEGEVFSEQFDILREDIREGREKSAQDVKERELFFSMLKGQVAEGSEELSERFKELESIVSQTLGREDEIEKFIASFQEQMSEIKEKGAVSPELEDRLVTLREKIAEQEKAVRLERERIRILVKDLSTLISTMPEKEKYLQQELVSLSVVEKILAKEGTRTREELVTRLGENLSEMEEKMRRDVGSDKEKDLKALLNKIETAFKAPKVSKISDKQRVQLMEQVAIVVRSSLEEGIASQTDKDLIDTIRVELAGEREKYEAVIGRLEEKLAGGDENKRVLQGKVSGFSRDIQAQGVSQDKLLMDIDKILSIVEAKALMGEGLGTEGEVFSEQFDMLREEVREGKEKSAQDAKERELFFSMLKGQIAEGGKELSERFKELESIVSQTLGREDEIEKIIGSFQEEMSEIKEKGGVSPELEGRLVMLRDEIAEQEEAVRLERERIRILVKEFSTLVSTMPEKEKYLQQELVALSTVEEILAKEGTRTSEELVIHLSERFSKMEERMRRDVGIDKQKDLKALLDKVETAFKAPKVSGISDEQRLQLMEQVVIAVRSSLEEGIASQIDKDLIEAIRVKLAGERNEYEAVISSLEQKLAYGDENRRGLQEKVSGFSRDIQAQGISQDKILIDIDKILSIVEAKALMGEGLGIEGVDLAKQLDILREDVREGMEKSARDVKERELFFSTLKGQIAEGGKELSERFKELESIVSQTFGREDEIEKIIGSFQEDLSEIKEKGGAFPELEGRLVTLRERIAEQEEAVSVERESLSVLVKEVGILMLAMPEKSKHVQQELVALKKQVEGSENLIMKLQVLEDSSEEAAVSIKEDEPLGNLEKIIEDKEKSGTSTWDVKQRVFIIQQLEALKKSIVDREKIEIFTKDDREKFIMELRETFQKPGILELENKKLLAQVHEFIKEETHRSFQKESAELLRILEKDLTKDRSEFIKMFTHQQDSAEFKMLLKQLELLQQKIPREYGHGEGLVESLDIMVAGKEVEREGRSEEIRGSIDRLKRELALYDERSSEHIEEVQRLNEKLESMKVELQYTTDSLEVRSSEDYLKLLTTLREDIKSMEQKAQNEEMFIAVERQKFEGELQKLIDSGVSVGQQDVKRRELEGKIHSLKTKFDEVRAEISKRYSLAEKLTDAVYKKKEEVLSYDKVRKELVQELIDLQQQLSDEEDAARKEDLMRIDSEREERENIIKKLKGLIKKERSERQEERALIMEQLYKLREEKERRQEGERKDRIKESIKKKESLIGKERQARLLRRAKRKKEERKIRMGMTPSIELMELERTQEPIDSSNFFIYKLEYQDGEEIRTSLEGTAEGLGGDVEPGLKRSLENVKYLPSSNSILVSGTRDVLKKIRVLISNMDVPIRQVFIEMLIVETTINNALDFGVEWGGHMKRDGVALNSGAGFYPQGSTLGTSLQSLATTESLVPTSMPSTTGGFNLGIIGRVLTHNEEIFTSLGALVRAISQDGNTNIILNPQIVTEEGNAAEIFVGQTSRYKATSVTQIGGNVEATYETTQIGTSLKITPRLGNRVDVVTLDIEQDVSDIIGGDVEIGPMTSSSTTKTRVHIPDKNFLIISGMIQEKAVETRSKIPCLGGAAIIGALFKEEAITKEKRNLMIFIRPHILSDEEDIKDVTRSREALFKKESVNESQYFEIRSGLKVLNLPHKGLD